MSTAIKDMFQSKKFLAAVGAGMAWLLIRVGTKYGITVDQELAAQWADRVLAMATVYIVGQASADFGKEAKKDV